MPAFSAPNFNGIRRQSLAQCTAYAADPAAAGLGTGEASTESLVDPTLQIQLVPSIKAQAQHISGFGVARKK